MKIKRFIIVVLCLFLVGGISFFAIQLYFYKYPAIEIYISSNSSDDAKTDYPHLSYYQRSIFGYSKKTESDIVSSWSGIGDVLQDYTENYSAPKEFKVSVIKHNKKTEIVINWRGVDGDGVAKEYSDSFVLNYPVGEVIYQNNKSD